MVRGETFHLRFEINEKIVNGFADLFNDHNPLHSQQQFAQSYGFADIVVHGNILNGFLSYFIGECLPQKNVIIQKQEIQFHLPVYRNDLLDLHAQIEEVFESVNTVEIKFEFVNSLEKKVARGKIFIGILV